MGFLNYYLCDSTLMEGMAALISIISNSNLLLENGAQSSSVSRGRDSWSEGPGFNPLCGRLLPTGWVGVSIM